MPLSVSISGDERREASLATVPGHTNCWDFLLMAFIWFWNPASRASGRNLMRMRNVGPSKAEIPKIKGPFWEVRVFGRAQGTSTNGEMGQIRKET